VSTTQPQRLYETSDLAKAVGITAQAARASLKATGVAPDAVTSRGSLYGEHSVKTWKEARRLRGLRAGHTLSDPALQLGTGPTDWQRRLSLP
jgi:hypothetical protein